MPAIPAISQNAVVPSPLASDLSVQAGRDAFSALLAIGGDRAETSRIELAPKAAARPPESEDVLSGDRHRDDKRPDPEAAYVAAPAENLPPEDAPAAQEKIAADHSAEKEESRSGAPSHEKDAIPSAAPVRSESPSAAKAEPSAAVPPVAPAVEQVAVPAAQERPQPGAATDALADAVSATLLRLLQLLGAELLGQPGLYPAPNDPQAVRLALHGPQSQGANPQPGTEELAALYDSLKQLYGLSDSLRGLLPQGAVEGTRANAEALRLLGAINKEFAALSEAFQRLGGGDARAPQLFEIASTHLGALRLQIPGALRETPELTTYAPPPAFPVAVPDEKPKSSQPGAPEKPPLLVDIDAPLREAHATGAVKGPLHSPGLPMPPVLPEAEAAAKPSLNVNGQPVGVPIAAPVTSVSAGANTPSGQGGQGQGSNLPAPSVTPLSASGQTPAASSPAFARLLSPTPARPLQEQVIFHVRSALKDGSSRIRIQLDPAELGKIDIQLRVSAEGKTGVSITADHRHTLDLLQRDAAALERALADAGLKTGGESLSFNLRGGRQDGESHQAAMNYKKALPEEEAPPVETVSRSYVVNLAEGLDISI